jgi:hypothetical protein
MANLACISNALIFYQENPIPATSIPFKRTSNYVDKLIKSFYKSLFHLKQVKFYRGDCPKVFFINKFDSCT